MHGVRGKLPSQVTAAETGKVWESGARSQRRRDYLGLNLGTSGVGVLGTDRGSHDDEEVTACGWLGLQRASDQS